MPIINSMLDNDLYKFSMGDAVCRLYPRTEVKYEYINRGKTEFPEGFADALRKEIGQMRELRLHNHERRFLENNCAFLSPLYLDFLSGFRFNPESVYVEQQGGRLEIEIRGLWGREILWEVPLMAIISELYFKLTGKKAEITRRNDTYKADQFGQMTLADFGTRRRYSHDNQERIVKIFKENCPGFIGTSNVYFAMKYGLKPIGTQAHEWFQAHSAMFGYRMANRMAMDKWVEVFRGDLGIALSDTFTTDVFYQDFDMKLAKLFDGVRQDSGDPFQFIHKTLAHYEKLGIDPKSKTIVFSDGLDVETAIEIDNHAYGKIKTAYGVGTNLTNDVGVEPLNMVIKMTGFKPHGRGWKNVIKLSDSPGKHTGDPDEVKLCKRILGVE